jgi:hypothetical protein
MRTERLRKSMVWLCAATTVLSFLGAGTKALAEDTKPDPRETKRRTRTVETPETNTGPNLGPKAPAEVMRQENQKEAVGYVTEEGKRPKLVDMRELPIRVFGLTFEGAPSTDGTWTYAETAQMIREINGIYAPWGIQWRIANQGKMRVAIEDFKAPGFVMHDLRERERREIAPEGPEGASWRRNRWGYHDDRDAVPDNFKQRLVGGLQEPPPIGMLQIVLVRRFQRDMKETSFYEPGLRTIFAAEYRISGDKKSAERLTPAQIAHELAKALGLPTVGDKDDLMYSKKPTTKEQCQLREPQILRLQAGADRMLASGRIQAAQQAGETPGTLFRRGSRNAENPASLPLTSEGRQQKENLYTFPGENPKFEDDIPPTNNVTEPEEAPPLEIVEDEPEKPKMKAEDVPGLFGPSQPRD